MTIGDSFRSVAALMDRIETGGFEVEDVTVPDDTFLADGRLRVGLALRAPVLDSIDRDEKVDVEPVDVRFDNGAVAADIEVSVVVGDDEIGDVTAADGEIGGDERIPAYKDPDRLAAVYEEHESFPELREALGGDVSAQTVRRHMIDHGIHVPESANTVEEPPPDEPGSDDGATTIADGIGLPEGVLLHDVKATVLEARTMDDVESSLDIDRDRAKRLLSELNLIDLVGGRLADEADRPGTAEEIDRRIREAAPPQA